jgi:hypothetical protein
MALAFPRGVDGRRAHYDATFRSAQTAFQAAKELGGLERRV